MYAQTVHNIGLNLTTNAVQVSPKKDGVLCRGNNITVNMSLSIPNGKTYGQLITEWVQTERGLLLCSSGPPPGFLNHDNPGCFKIHPSAGDLALYHLAYYTLYANNAIVAQGSLGFGTAWSANVTVSENTELRLQLSFNIDGLPNGYAPLSKNLCSCYIKPYYLPPACYAHHFRR